MGPQNADPYRKTVFFYLEKNKTFFLSKPFFLDTSILACMQLLPKVKGNVLNLRLLNVSVDDRIH